MRVRALTRALDRRLPGGVTTRLRALALLWGRLTSWGRMTPSIIVVGAQRSGTTTLFRLLEAHPHLVRPTLDKGTGYFDDHYGRGRRWYVAHFPMRSVVRARAKAAGVEGRVQAFECSGYYLFHPLAAERLARDLPDAQVVVLVRDPVERASSAHRHEVARGFETLPLGEALDAEDLRTRGESTRLKSEPGYASFEHRHHAYVQRGEYAHQITRFVDALGEDRVHVVDADRFFAAPEQEFADLQQRLGLPAWSPPTVERWNGRPATAPGDTTDDELRSRLMRHYETHDAELARLLGHEPSWRTAEVAS